MRNHQYEYLNFNVIIAGLLSLNLLFHLPLTAQKVLEIDENLKIHSTPLVVKRKGVKRVGKYQFGEYRIKEGKTSWITEKPSRKNGVAESKSEQTLAFTLLANEIDTIQAHIGIYTSQIEEVSFLSDLMGWDYQKITESNESTSLTFNSIHKSTWNLIISGPRGVEMSAIFNDYAQDFEGALTDGTQIIRIELLFEREDGRSSLINPVMGYQFMGDDQVMGAVQVYPLNKQRVWINENLDKEMQAVVATTATALLIKHM